MNSKQIKEAFAAAGIKVRVADQGAKFRICRIVRAGVDAAHEAASQAVAGALGLTGTDGKPGGDIQQPHEMVAYKPGMARVLFGLAA